MNEKSGMFKNKGENQMKEIVNSSKVSVFFIDEHQRVTTSDVGNKADIIKFAEEKGAKVTKLKLESQFRCSGSDGFISWIDNTLDIEKTANILWKSNEEGFDFKICSSAEEVDNLIRKKSVEGYKSRMMAGFCWPWNEEGNKDGTLANDVKIGDYKKTMES